MNASTKKTAEHTTTEADSGVHPKASAPADTVVTIPLSLLRALAAPLVASDPLEPLVPGMFHALAKDIEMLHDALAGDRGDMAAADDFAYSLHVRAEAMGELAKLVAAGEVPAGGKGEVQ